MRNLWGRITSARRPHLRRSVWIAIVLLSIAGALVVEQVTRRTPYVRDQAVSALNAKFASQVEVDNLQVSAFPRPEVVGEGIVLRFNGRTDVPPLLEVKHFSASAGLLGLWGDPLHLTTVELEGLDISIPTGGLKGDDRQAHSGTLVIDEMRARTATLEIASKNPAKLPRHFDILNLVVTGIGEAEGAEFQAHLINPKPRGTIDTHGTFGPWQTDNPRTTPVRGDYRLSGADLNTIKGIGGILDSRGTYQGVLERIRVTGTTQTPDFRIDVSGQPVPLTTRFDALVDGTNGDTWLERVDAKLRNTRIVAKGAVVRDRDVKRREISFDAAIDDGRLEDVLALAVKSAKPVMTGAITLKARIVIPAIDAKVIDKLQLAGDFELAQAHFTNLNVQRKINMLSRKGQGDDAGSDEGPSAVSNVRGRFVMRDAAIYFSQLTFGVEGAIVQLAGTYNLRGQTIDFAGDLLLDAPLAETTTGIKALAARIAQPFFQRKGGGSKIPIRISGTRDNPTFGLDAKRAFLKG